MTPGSECCMPCRISPCMICADLASPVVGPTVCPPRKGLCWVQHWLDARSRPPAGVQRPLQLRPADRSQSRGAIAILARTPVAGRISKRTAPDSPVDSDLSPHPRCRCRHDRCRRNRTSRNAPSSREWLRRVPSAIAVMRQALRPIRSSGIKVGPLAATRQNASITHASPVPPFHRAIPSHTRRVPDFRLLLPWSATPIAYGGRCPISQIGVTTRTATSRRRLQGRIGIVFHAGKTTVP